MVGKNDEGSFFFIMWKKSNGIVKIMYPDSSATKFDEITYYREKKVWRFGNICVAFSEYMNINKAKRILLRLGIQTHGFE